MLDTVQEIQERHTAIKELERQLLGLHQLFVDLSTLVDQQGEQLENIATQAWPTCAARGAQGARERWRLGAVAHFVQVHKAGEFVTQGTKYIGEAKTLQKNTRKWMCCLVMMCAL